MALLKTIPTLGLAPALTDLGLDAKAVRTEPSARAGAANTLCCAAGAEARPSDDDAALRAELAPWKAATSGVEDTLLLVLEGDRDDRELARWRDAAWPEHHLVAIDRLGHTGIVQRTLQGAREVRGGSGVRGELLVLRPRAAVFARDAVAAKFDQNAGGWNGEPGKPGYAHFRWMRRYVGTFADARGKARILDFGCGAGWVGIKATLVARSAELCAFDPSPAMCELARANASANGIARFEARVGFGEDPPFPAAGEAPFDLVISSGVISFSGDFDRFLDGLARAVAPGGTLVIGDLNNRSNGMRRRRAERPLLPLRELNAPEPGAVRAALERRGFRFRAEAGYQLTSPFPELAHWSARRLGGALDGLLVAWNARRAGPGRPERFDSWVLAFDRA
ncbi:MAG: methyltransferase domain-containing protein [Planctomycetes bacterium]|nr:methyltransferase domain-containing protein [Planctomycetota bacterium]